ncbi:MAG: epoxyqueuosine reductase QueH [Deltaproteobacteria bacterium]|nr:epoxyqueuosine reductase QueH [Deltaproteobacteria bacterium]
MKILLHICCANCALYPLKRLRDEGHEVFGFFYNPNIHPYQEYSRRLDAVKDIENRLAVRMIYLDRYDLEDFLRSVAFREGERCRICYHRRLEATGRAAKKGKFDAFTTTLLGSKLQDYSLIKEIGFAVGREQGVAFYDADFREGWKAGIEMSKELNLYRQQYCGCIYSEKERFAPKKVKRSPSICR